MSEYGVVTEPGTVRFERLLPGPIERVWAYLTDSEKRGKWLAAGQMEARVGGRVELKFHHTDLSPHKEPTAEKYKECAEGITLQGRVTRCEAPRLLSYTWDEGPKEASEVTFELTPRGSEVLLTLVHCRLTPKAMVDVAGGWHTHLDILVDHLNAREPKPFWSTHGKLQSEYERRLNP